MDFPSNSLNVTGDKSPKEEKPKKDVQKVVTGEVIQRPPTIGRRFRTIFFGHEFKGATKYVVTDVLLPALKNMVVDATSKGMERIVYGETGPRRRSMELGRPRFSYNQPVDRYRDRDRGRPGMLPDQPPLYRPSPRRHASSEIILVSRADAELTLERLTDIVDKYDVASVADLNELAGLPSAYTDNSWGWSNLAGSDIRQIREGYLLVLPNPEPI
jgi:hypothetical protein